MASRSELFARLGILKPLVDPILNAAYKLEEQQIWEKDLFNSPHGEHWHTSFHASSFPGDDEKACGRKAIYTLMNIPDFDPINRDGRAIMDAGKDVEKQIVTRFDRSGVLLSNDAGANYQLGFEDSEHWLTGSPDAVIRLPQFNRPHVVEVKSKDQKAVEEMQMGMRSFSPEHRRQVLTYIGLAHEMPEQINQVGGVSIWPVDMDSEVNDGTILYVSRDRPGTTHEYRFQYNKDFMDKGREVLASWKRQYLAEHLPDRPKSWKWTEQPCKWCPVKKICKADYKAEEQRLYKSAGIAHAKEVRGEYDYEDTRGAVLARWGLDDSQGGETNGD